MLDLMASMPTRNFLPQITRIPLEVVVPQGLNWNFYTCEHFCWNEIFEALTFLIQVHLC